MTPGKDLKELEEPAKDPRSTLVVPSQGKWQRTDKLTDLTLSFELGVCLCGARLIITAPLSA